MGRVSGAIATAGKRAAAIKLARDVKDLQTALESQLEALGELTITHRPATVDICQELSELSQIQSELSQKQATLESLRGARGSRLVAKELSEEVLQLHCRRKAVMASIGRKAFAKRPDLPGAQAAYTAVDRLASTVDARRAELTRLEAEIGTTGVGGGIVKPLLFVVALTVGIVVLFAVVAPVLFGRKGAEYYSHVDGRRKIFDVKVTVSLGGIVQGTAIERQEGTVTIGPLVYDKSTMTSEGIPGRDTITQYSRVGKDGIYSRNSTDLSSHDSLDLPLPPDVGRTWTNVDDDKVTQYTIVAVEDLDTSRKTYKRCLKIKGSSMAGGSRVVESVLYYAPGIGVVKLTMREASKSLEMSLRAEESR